MSVIPARAQAILNFWFGAPDTPEYLGPRSIWFKKNERFDSEIRAKHLGDYETAREGGHDDWREAAPSSLALVVTLDQFPRNMFRDDPQAFATDEKALQSAQDAIEKGFDKEALPHQRIFYYLPFEHSEDILMQERCLILIDTMPEFDLKSGYYDYALRHHKIIERFGRFPHRNAVLGRENTEDEREYLSQPGAGF